MKKHAHYLLIALMVFTINFANAQKKYEISVDLNAFVDSTIFLSYYYGHGQFYKDTGIVNQKGIVTFEGTDTLEHGLYSIIAKNAKLFDFMVDEQFIEFQTDTTDIVMNMKVKGSEENDRFYHYLKFLNVKQAEAKKLKEDTLMATDKRTKALKDLDDEVRGYINKLHTDHPKSFTSNFIYSIEFPQVPEAPRNPDGSMVDSNFSFLYYKTHYFDNFDFGDARLLRTNSFHSKMTYYMNKLTLQDPDSIIVSADYILGKAEANEDLFRYALTTLTSTYERSEQMGMDAVFVHLGKNYFMKGKANKWFSEKQINELAERVNALDPLLIGKKAPNIVVKDTAQKEFLQLYEVKSNYTVVYIWSPECGHCKVATPKLKDLYDKYKDQGLEVFAVGNEFENKEWIEFIDRYELDWINGSDGGEFRSNFRQLYDVYSTPQTYLLDKDKKILSKKMSIESLENILEYFLKKDKAAEEKAMNEN